MDPNKDQLTLSKGIEPDEQRQPIPVSMQSTNVASIAGATVISKNTKKKNILIILAATLVLTGAGALYYFVLKKDNPPVNPINKSVEQASTGYEYVPRFDSVNAVAEFAGAKWYSAVGGVVRVANGRATFLLVARVFRVVHLKDCMCTMTNSGLLPKMVLHT